MLVARRVALALLAATALAGPGMAQDRPLVAVTAIVEHPALDATRDGVKEGLAAEGFVDGRTITFRYESAQGSPAIFIQRSQLRPAQPDLAPRRTIESGEQGQQRGLAGARGPDQCHRFTPHDGEINAVEDGQRPFRTANLFYQSRCTQHGITIHAIRHS